MRRPEVLGAAECWRLLGQQKMGRVAFTERALPTIMPVNYTLFGNQVLIRVRADGLGQRMDKQIVAFEVDGVDEERHIGWSVVATGAAEFLGDGQALTGLLAAVPPSWAGPDHQALLSISPGYVQGRRLATADAEGTQGHPLVVAEPTAPSSGEKVATDLAQRLRELVPDLHFLVEETITDDYTHDESLRCTPVRPAIVVFPLTTADVVAVLTVADQMRLPVTARGSGTGLAGGCVPNKAGIVMAFERMNRILEIDTDNQVAVVQPGVTLAQLDAATSSHGLVYPVFPGENSASLGGNVATNAGGMRAVKYGVTRHQVLGLEAVLATGEVIRTGGKFVKATSGYDLTQLIVGSEGTLAVATEIVLKLYPRPAHSATILVPFRSLSEITAAVPRIIANGSDPLVLEYIDALSMAAATANVGLDLGIPAEVKEAARAYLVVVLENNRSDRLDEDISALAGILEELGSIDVYVLPPGSAAQLLDAREKSFWVAKQFGANDIIDVVVPRAAIPGYLETVSNLADKHGATVAGAGHAGDGNVHLSVFQPDPKKLEMLMHAIFEAGLALGGAISAEHGIGTDKKPYFLALEDPAKIRLMHGIKAAFDPHGILNPGTLLTPGPDAP